MLHIVFSNIVEFKKNSLQKKKIVYFVLVTEYVFHILSPIYLVRGRCLNIVLQTSTQISGASTCSRHWHQKLELICIM